MKRKHETAIEENEPNKSVKPNPAVIALQLLNEHGKTLTLKHLQTRFIDFSMAVVYELLVDLDTDSPIATHPAAQLLRNILFTYVFTADYSEADLSARDICKLLINYSSDRLPRFEGVLYNRWIEKLVNNKSGALQYLPELLHALQSISESRTVRYTRDEDVFNLNTITHYLSKFTKNLKENAENIPDQLLMIVNTINYFLEKRLCINKLDISIIEKILKKCNKESPKYTKIMDALTITLKYEAPIKNVPITVLSETLAWMTDTKRACEFFCRIIPDHYKFLNNKAENISTETLQGLINATIDADIELDILQEFIIQLGFLYKKRFISDQMNGIDKILEKITKHRNFKNSRLFNLLLAITHLSGGLATPLSVEIVEKFMPFDAMSIEVERICMAFTTICTLSSVEKLSGKFSINLFDFINHLSNDNSRVKRDLRVLNHILPFIGTILTKNYIDSTSNYHLLSELNNQVKLLLDLVPDIESVNDQKNINNIFNAISDISKLKEFNHTFNPENLNILIKKGVKNSDHAIRLHALGIAAKNNCLKRFPVETLNIIMERSFVPFKPENLFKYFTAWIYFTTNKALDKDIDQHYLIKKFIYFSNNMNKYDFNLPWEIKRHWKEHVHDIPFLLQFPPDLKGKILHFLLPFMVEILKDTPDIIAIDAIFDAFEKLMNTSYLLEINAQDMQDLFEIFYAIKKDDPEAVFHVLRIIEKLTQKGLIDEKVTINLLVPTLFDILPQQLIYGNAQKLLEKTQTLLHYQIDIISACTEFLLQILQEKMPIDMAYITDILETIRLLIKEKKQVENFLLGSKQKWVGTVENFEVNKEVEQEKYFVILNKKQTVMDECLQLLIKMPNVRKDLLISILNTVFCQVKENIRDKITFEHIFFLFIKLQKLDHEALFDICLEHLPFFLEEKQAGKLYTKYPLKNFSITTILHLFIFYSKNHDVEACSQLIEHLLANFMKKSAKADNTYDAKMAFFFVNTANYSKVLNTCKQTAKFLEADAQSPEFPDASFHAILRMLLNGAIPAKNSEQTILILFTLITCEGFANPHIDSALKSIQSFEEQSPFKEDVVFRLNNMIPYARKYSMFISSAEMSSSVRKTKEDIHEYNDALAIFTSFLEHKKMKL